MPHFYKVYGFSALQECLYLYRFNKEADINGNNGPIF